MNLEAITIIIFEIRIRAIFIAFLLISVNIYNAFIKTIGRARARVTRKLEINYFSLKVIR